jgi:hypothetical protein
MVVPTVQAQCEAPHQQPPHRACHQEGPACQGLGGFRKHADPALTKPARQRFHHSEGSKVKPARATSALLFKPVLICASPRQPRHRHLARQRLGPGDRARPGRTASRPRGADGNICGRRPVDFSTSRARGAPDSGRGRPRSPGPCGSLSMRFPRHRLKRPGPLE